jgi:uncharacterized lipoprotein YmbA
MKIFNRPLRLGALASVLCFLAACNLPEPQADTVRHFTLGGEVGPPPVANGTQVRPVQLAGHLHGRAMAVRVAENEVIYLDDIRWAEPLDAALTQILRARLGPVDGGATVSVEVQRFELVRSDGNKVQLAATYSVLPAGASQATAQRGVFNSASRTWDGKDPGVLVGLLREVAGELGDAIAAAVTARPATTAK